MRGLAWQMGFGMDAQESKVKSDQYAVVLEVVGTVWSRCIAHGAPRRRRYNIHKRWKQVLSINASTERHQQT